MDAPTERIGVKMSLQNLANVLAVEVSSLRDLDKSKCILVVETDGGRLSLALTAHQRDDLVEAMLEREELRSLLGVGVVSGEDPEFFVRTRTGASLAMTANSPSFHAEVRQYQTA